MKKNKDKFREYKIVKIVRNDKFYWRPMYKDDTTLSKEWHNLSVLVEDTDYLIPSEYRHKFGALRRIVKDIRFVESFDNGKYEIFEEFEVGKIKINI